MSANAAAPAVPSTMRVNAEQLAEAVADIFTALGIARGDAALVAHDIVLADLEGVASHGTMLVPMYVDRIMAGSVSNKRQGDVVSDNKTAIVIDAGNALGQLTAHQAVKLAVARAKELGMASVAVRNAFHFGTAGRYARLMAEQDCVGIVMSNTRPLMPAPGGAEAITGNNPIAIALPSAGEFPVEVDMALSATAMGRIRLAAAAGQSIPPDWAMAADGKPTTDPNEAIKGMLAPAAGPKGFGLALGSICCVAGFPEARSAPRCVHSMAIPPSLTAARSFSWRFMRARFPPEPALQSVSASRHSVSRGPSVRRGSRVSTHRANSRMQRDWGTGTPAPLVSRHSRA